MPRPLRFWRLISRKETELCHMLVLNTNRISYIGIPTPQSHLPLCDLERSKLRCWKWSKIDTCMVGYSVRVNPRFQLFESAAVRLSYKSAENWHSSYQLQLSSMTPRSMDILFVCCCCFFFFFFLNMGPHGRKMFKRHLLWNYTADFLPKIHVYFR